VPAPLLDDDHEPEQRFVPEPEDHRPAPKVELGPDLPVERDGDLDPLTAPLLDDEDDGAAALIDPVAAWVGIRFAPAGKIFPFDSGEARYERGDRVVVEAEGRGTRLATVAVATLRRPIRGERKLPRVLRKAGEHELRAEATAEAQGRTALLTAKEKARVLDLPIKVFRVEPQSGRRLLVYYTSDERIDLRDFLREVGAATGARVELRQIGARDEAKMVGGIGSCGQELCCTTWLPEMVPVSIKMAKDQGLVLNPTKVSGQCGRLKCCLVYEQATYAEMRKGLPKLGKRVITPHGEGRVVEVDVLRQRIRVTTGPGEFHVLAAGEVTPMFPSQRAPSEAEPPESPEGHDEPEEPEPAS
jgi:cell fate regulator YaaT (PSP1 superfamily)